MHLVYCNEESQVFDHPAYAPAFREGRGFCKVRKPDLVALPYGSLIFSLPGRIPIYFDSKRGDFIALEKIGSQKVWAAASFLSSGYLRTYLPAYQTGPKVPLLSLWAYGGVVFMDDGFYVPAIRIDDDIRSDPEIHENDPALKRRIKTLTNQYPKNRLVKQLALCASEYRCLCARNFFLERFEVPVPTTPSCNAKCLGCLSHQDEKAGFKPSQNRLAFKPTPEEITEVILHHFKHVKKPIASFGQGCEGEPILRGKDLAKAIKLVRAKTDQGTININTNGSLPEMVGLLIESGLDSIRISVNSLNPRYYSSYYKPVGYTFDDVLRSIDIALTAGIFVSMNLFFLPGVTDSEHEVKTLVNFLRKFPISMLQTRNLNIDPDFYMDSIDFKDSKPLGIKNLIKDLKKGFPQLKLGYYNPALR